METQELNEQTWKVRGLEGSLLIFKGRKEYVTSNSQGILLTVIKSEDLDEKERKDAVVFEGTQLDKPQNLLLCQRVYPSLKIRDIMNYGSTEKRGKIYEALK